MALEQEPRPRLKHPIICQLLVRPNPTQQRRTLLSILVTTTLKKRVRRDTSDVTPSKTSPSSGQWFKPHPPQLGQAPTHCATSEVSKTSPSSCESLTDTNDDDGLLNLQSGVQNLTKNARPGSAIRKRLANAGLKIGAEATSGPWTRARVRAEASRSFPTSCKAQSYSATEDELLRKLVGRGLPWKQIEMEFGQDFSGRNLRSLKVCWSRYLKFAARSERLSKRREADDRVGRRCFL